MESYLDYLSTPSGVVAATIAGFIVFQILKTLFCSSGKKKVEEPKEQIKLTLSQLKEYDGSNGKLYMCCRGYIFDVTNAEAFQKGGNYEKFAGRDVSMACAHFTHDVSYLDMEYDDEKTFLEVDKEQNLQGFFLSFCNRYDIVGRLVKESAK